jgi:diacylglycerol kinase family enzyme
MKVAAEPRYCAASAATDAPPRTGMRVALLLNRGAGTLRSLDADSAAAAVADCFRRRGHEVDVEISSGEAIIDAITRASKSEAYDALVVGGGDGTVSAAAAAAAASRLALGVLPLGTMNLFARSLGIPLELEAAAAALAQAEIAAVDIGVVNGRYFIHHVTLGLHPRMIRERERFAYASRWGKILAAVRAWWLVLRHPPRLTAQLRLDEQVLQRRTASILVSNNPVGDGHLPYADDLHQGRLGVYVTTSRRVPDLLRLFFHMLLGDVSDNPFLDHWRAKRAEIDLPERSVPVSIDGELIRLETPLCIELHRGGLKVLQPTHPSAAFAVN